MSPRVLLVFLCVAYCAHLISCETVNILINEYQVPLVEIHIANYSALTGHTVSINTLLKRVLDIRVFTY